MIPRLLMSFLVLVSLSLQAKPIPELTNFVEEQSTVLSTALSEGNDSAAWEALGGWEFKRFFLRVGAKVGFDIEAIKLELLPELELVWQKDPRVLKIHWQ